MSSAEYFLREELAGHDEDVSIAGIWQLNFGANARGTAVQGCTVQSFTAFNAPTSVPECAIGCAQVRAVAVSELGVITGSRDKSVRIWSERGGHFELEAMLVS